MTKPTASLDEVVLAAQVAGAHEFIQRLPHGYSTMLEESAANLSGGQRQRLAIARALIHDPPMLVFDEATSSLDPESEAIIQQHLAGIARGRTIVIITHRLSFVARADAIIVVDQGRLVQVGRHESAAARLPALQPAVELSRRGCTNERQRSLSHRPASRWRRRRQMPLHRRRAR